MQISRSAAKHAGGTTPLCFTHLLIGCAGCDPIRLLCHIYVRWCPHSQIPRTELFFSETRIPHHCICRHHRMTTCWIGTPVCTTAAPAQNVQQDMQNKPYCQYSTHTRITAATPALYSIHYTSCTVKTCKTRWCCLLRNTLLDNMHKQQLS